jgi:hypothetical protein
MIQTDEEEQQNYKKCIVSNASDSHNLHFIECHLFYEIVSNITIGLADEDYVPLTLDEQKGFFQRDDVRRIIKSIVITFLSDLREDQEWNGGIENDWIREYVYGPKGLSDIYGKLPKIPSNSDNPNISLLSISEYEPIFSK